MFDLHDTTTLIYGPASTLSAGIAAAFTTAHASVHHLPDTDDPDTLKIRLQGLKRLDTLVILPLVGLAKPFMVTTDADWDAIISGNFEQALWTAQAFARLLLTRQHPGSLIWVSSIAGQMPLVDLTAVGTVAGAIRALAKMAAVDLAPHQVTVNVIECGLLASAFPVAELTPEAQAHIRTGTPTGKLTTPADIGHLACFLASPLARNLTGGIIPLDGGYTLTRSDGASPLAP